MQINKHKFTRVCVTKPKTANAYILVCHSPAIAHNRSQFRALTAQYNKFDDSVLLVDLSPSKSRRMHTWMIGQGECNAFKCELTKSSSVV